LGFFVTILAGFQEFFGRRQGEAGMLKGQGKSWKITSLMDAVAICGQRLCIGVVQIQIVTRMRGDTVQIEHTAIMEAAINQ
jgi:hypothetical protein